MSNYKRLTNEELNDFTSRVVVRLEPTLTQQVMSLILELTEYRTKIENETLIELPCIMQDHKKEYRVYFYNKTFKCIDCYVRKTKTEAEAKLKELKRLFILS